MKKIIVGVDFSSESRQALNVAINWSRVLNLPLKVVHSFHFAVDPALEIAGGKFSDLKNQLKDQLHQNLTSFCSEVSSDWEQEAGQVEIEISFEAPYEFHLQKYATTGPDNLLVVGSRGHGLLHRFAIGSTTEKLISRGSVPVLSVKNSNVFNPKKILVPMTLQQDESSSLLLAIELAGLFGSEVEIIHIHGPAHLLFETGFPFNDWDNFSKQEKRLKQLAQENLQEILRRYGQMISLSGRILESDGRSDGKMLLDIIEKENPDLVCLSAFSNQQRESLWPMGHTADFLVRRLQCSVLLGK